MRLQIYGSFNLAEALNHGIYWYFVTLNRTLVGRHLSAVLKCALARLLKIPILYAPKLLE